VPAKKARKPAKRRAPRRKGAWIKPPHTARFELVMLPDEKREIVEAAQRSGEPSIARFVVNAALMRARGQSPRT
jgi:hypothetical protein